MFGHFRGNWAYVEPKFVWRAFKKELLLALWLAIMQSYVHTRFNCCHCYLLGTTIKILFVWCSWTDSKLVADTCAGAGQWEQLPEPEPVPVSLPGPGGQDSPRPPLPRRPAPPSPAAAGRTAGGQGGARQLSPTARLRQALERSELFMMCTYSIWSKWRVREKNMITVPHKTSTMKWQKLWFKHRKSNKVNLFN